MSPYKNHAKKLEYARKYRQEHKAESVIYHRKWRKEHPEKEKEYQRRYYEAHRDFRIESRRKYHQIHVEQENERNRQWYLAHREEYLAKKKKYRSEHSKEQSVAKHREWLLKNPHAQSAHYFALTYIPLKNTCELCGSTERLVRHHSDYAKPLSVITVCRSCHRRIHTPYFNLTKVTQ